MPINGMVLKDAATGITVVGGSDMTFQSDGVAVANGVHVANMAQTDFRIRENVTVKYRPPKQNTDLTWSKGKWSITYAEPSLDANGRVLYDVGRLEIELNPGSAASVGTNIRRMLAQLATDSDLDNYFAGGSIV